MDSPSRFFPFAARHDSEYGIIVSEIATQGVNKPNDHKARIVVIGDFEDEHHTSFINGIKSGDEG